MIEKTLAGIYLDASQPASFGGLDAVYRAVKEKGKNKISCKQVRDWLSRMFILFTNPREDATREAESSFLE